MTNIEKVIEVLEDFRDYVYIEIENDSECTVGLEPELINIISLSVQSIKEKQERELGCEHCTCEKKELVMTNTGSTLFICQKIDGEYIQHTNGYGFKIKYCPICGRKLGGNE